MLMLVLLAVCAGLCSPAALRCESCGAMPPLQVACESLGPLKKGGRVIGVDLQVGLLFTMVEEDLQGQSPCMHKMLLHTARRPS